MPKFIFAYHGGTTPETPEAAEAEMAQWMTWLEGMGSACIDMGNPVGMSHTVTASAIETNGGSNPLSGYSIVEATDMDAACQIAKGCPILNEASGTVEVAPIAEM